MTWTSIILDSMGRLKPRHTVIMNRTLDVVDDCILLRVVLKYVFALVNVFILAATDDGATDSDVEVDDDDGSIVRAFSSMINSVLFPMIVTTKSNGKRQDSSVLFEYFPYIHPSIHIRTASERAPSPPKS
mgnify:CR=1 FL=1